MNGNAVSNTPKTGAGYARITLKSIYKDPNIKTLTLSNGKLLPKFDSNTYEYHVSLDAEQSLIHIAAIPEAADSVITGIGDINVPDRKSVV